VGLDKISISFRTLSCFCEFCTIRGDGACDNATYVPPYTVIRLEPCHPGNGRMDIEPQSLSGGTDWQALAEAFQVGDNFTVVAEEGNSKGVEFYVLLCQEGLHVMQEAEAEDCWGQKVYRG
jgi:hypothetical protein